MSDQFQIPVKLDVVGTVNVTDCLDGLLKHFNLIPQHNGYLVERVGVLYEVYDISTHGSPVEAQRVVTTDKNKISFYNHIMELKGLLPFITKE